MSQEAFPDPPSLCPSLVPKDNSKEYTAPAKESKELLGREEEKILPYSWPSHQLSPGCLVS